MTEKIEVIGRIGLIIMLFLFLSLYLESASLSTYKEDFIDIEKANEESLANLWGLESVFGISDTIDRSSDTFLIAGLFFIGALAIHSQFISEQKKESK